MMFSKVFTSMCAGLLVSIPVSFAGPVINSNDPNAGLVTNPTSTSTLINQQTQILSLQWNSFNVNQNELVQFVQPNSSAIAVNHIDSLDPSTIAGNLTANGQIVLVNPNGLIFTETAVVDVGGIVASGLNINSEAFLNGSAFLNHEQNADGFVINNGVINASIGGSVTLVGTQVENNGLISASLGKVNLAAGKSGVLTFDANGLFGVEVSGDTVQNILGNDAAVTNNGEIASEGGQVLLTAEVSRDVFTNAVNNQGVVNANSVEFHDGFIRISSSTGDVQNDGTLDASSIDDTKGGTVEVIAENINNTGVIKTDSENSDGGLIHLEAKVTTMLVADSSLSAQAMTNGVGGTINVLGDFVGLADNTFINTSGISGGGQIHIGGGFQGNDDTLKNAIQAYIAQNVNLYADAIETGDGGEVIVWSNYYTQYFGNLSAAGGVYGGNGGFAEISGKEYLQFSGDVSLSAYSGNGGLLLLDPDSITIRASGGSNVTSLPNTSDYTLVFDNPDTTTNITIRPNEITTLLSGGFDLELQASNDINVDSPINVTNSGAGDLTLTANDDIKLNANIDINGTLTLTADADNGDLGDASNSDNRNHGSIELETNVNLTASSVIFEELVESTDGESNTLTVNGNAQFDEIVGISFANGRNLGALTVNGTVTSNASAIYVENAIEFDGLVLNADLQLDSGSDFNSSPGVTINGLIDGNSNSLDIYAYSSTGALGAITIRPDETTPLNTDQVITDLNVLSVYGGQSFNLTGTVAVTELDLRDINTNFFFDGAVTATTLTTFDQAYGIQFLNGGTISSVRINDGSDNFTNNVMTHNGGLTFGDETTDSFTITNTFTYTDGTTYLFGSAGTPNANTNSFTLGNVVLNSDAKLTTGSTSGGNIVINGTINGSTGGAEDLELEAGTGTVTLQGEVGGGTELGGLTISSAQSSDIQTNVTTSGTDATGIILTSTDFIDLNSITLTSNGNPIVYNTNDNNGSLLANSTTNAGSSTVSIYPVNTSLVIGVNDTDQTYNLTQSELQTISASEIIVGSSNHQTDINVAGNATASSDLTLTTAGISFITGDDGGGPAIPYEINLFGNITTSGDVIRFDSPIVLQDTATDSFTLSTGGAGNAGDIIFPSLIDGTTLNTQALSLEAGDGSVVFNDIVGGTIALGDITITSADAVDITAAMSAGALTITHSGLLDITDSISLTGIFSQIDNGGSVNLNGSINTTNQAISFETAVVLTSNSSLSTDTGIGDITFTNDVSDDANSATLDLTAGTGDIAFNSTVGATGGIGDITIVSANDVDFTNTVVADSVTQDSGVGTTTFGNTIATLTSTGIDLTGTNFSFTNSVDTVTSGTQDGIVSIDNSGTLTIASTSGFNLGGAFTQNGAGDVNLGSGITTTNDTISFAGDVILIQSIALNSGNGVGDISFFGALDATTANTETLGLTAGTGDITFGGTVGSTTPLGAVTINSAGNVNINAAFNAASFTQTTGTGTTSIIDALTTTGVTGISITTNAIDFDRDNDGLVVGTIDSDSNDISYTSNTIDLGGSTTTGAVVNLLPATSTTDINIGSGGGYELTAAELNGITATTLNIGGATHGGDININAATTLTASVGTINFDNANANNINIGSSLTASTVDINYNFNSDVVLTANALINSGNGTIVFARDVSDSTTETLGLTAGTGNITFSSTVGNNGGLGAMTISSVNNVNFMNTVVADSITQDVGTGTTTFSNTVDTITATGLNLTGNNFSFANTVDTVTAGTQDGVVSINNSGVLTLQNTSSFNLGGAFTQTNNVTGMVSLGSDITTTNDAISFDSAVTLTDNVLLNSGTGTGNIMFSAAIEATTPGTPETLGVTAGTGDITFGGIVGSTTPLGAVTINSAGNVNINAAFNAASFTQTTGTGTTSIIDALTTTGATGISITTNAIDFDRDNDGLVVGTIDSGSNDISYTSNTIDLGGSTTTGAVVNLLPATSTTDINIGSGGGYELTAAELNGITATTLNIGGATHGGDININAATTLTASVGTINFDNANANNINIGSSLTASTVDINYNFNSDVVLTANALINSGNGTIVFARDVSDSTTETLGLTAGTGNITFSSTVGDNGGLGAMTISSVNNVNFMNTVLADSITQDVGTGTTTFSNTVDTITATGLNLTGNNFSFANTVDTVTAGTQDGVVSINNSGVLTLQNTSSFNLGGAFTQTNNVTGTVSLGSDITTTNDAISFFGSAVTLTDNVLLNSGTGTGNIMFSAAIEATTPGAPETLGLTAGTGDITFGGTVGSTTPLGAVTINSAGNVNINAAFNAASFTQTTGTGTTSISNSLSTTDVSGISITNNAVDFNGATISTTNDPVAYIANSINFGTTNAGTGDVSIIPLTNTTQINLGNDIGFGLTNAELNSITTASLTIGDAAHAGNIVVDATGLSLGASIDALILDNDESTNSISLGGSISTTDAAISFNSDITTTGASTITISTGAGNGDIVSSNNIVDSLNLLILEAGTGLIDLTGAGNDFNTLRINSANAANISDINSIVLGTVNVINTLDLAFGQGAVQASDAGSIVDLTAGNYQIGTFNITGGLSATDQMTVNDNDHTWIIDASGNGSVTGVSVLDATSVDVFTGIDQLNAGTGSDGFTIFSDNISLEIYGGNAPGTDSIGFDFNNAVWDGGQPDGTIRNTTNPSEVINYFGFESASYSGSGTTGIIGPDGGTHTWDINANNTVVLDFGLPGEATYNNISVIFAGDGVDTFNITADLSTLTDLGIIDGGDSNDIFNINISSTVYQSNPVNSSATFSTTISGSAGDDDFNLSGAFDGFSLDGGTNTVGAGLGDEIITTGTTHTFNVTASDGGTVDTNSFTEIEVLTGNASTDSLTVNVSTVGGATDTTSNWQLSTTPNVTISDLTPVQIDQYYFTGMETISGGDLADSFTVSANYSGTYNGGDGDDQFNLNSSVTLAILNGNGGDDAFILADGVTGYVIDGGINTGVGDEVQKTNGVNTWSFTALDSGLIASNSFSDIETLTGSGSDTLSINISVGTIVTDTTTTFVVDSSSTATVYDLSPTAVDTFNFSGMSTLIGGDLADTFDINTVVDGMTLNGGGDNDTLDADLIAGSITISDPVLGGGTFTVSANTLNFNSIQIFSDAGITIGDFVINGPSAPITYTLDASGSVSFGSLSFANVDILNGGAAADTFIIQGDFGGVVNGNAAADIFQIDTDTLSAATELYGYDLATLSTDADIVQGIYVGQTGAVNYDWQIDTTTWTVGGSTNASINGALIYDIYAFGGSTDSNITDTLSSNINSNTWQINSTDSTVDVYTFNNFENLSGGSQVDTFTFDAAITGDVNGNDGNDIFNINVDTAAANIFGDADDDVFILASGVATNTLHGNGEATTGDEVRATGTSNDWLISASDGGSVNTNTFDGVEVLTGNAATDTLTVNVSTTGGATDTNAVWLIDATPTVQINTTDVVPVLVDQYAFIDMENITGGDLIDDFILDASVLGNVSGGNGDDTFDVNVASAAVTIDGGNGNDNFTLDATGAVTNIIGNNGNDTFYINQNSVATLITGNGDTDIFELADGVTGNVIDGGSFVTNGDEVVANGTTNTWSITSLNQGDVNGNSFSLIEWLTGNGSSDTISINVSTIGGATDTYTDWVIDATPSVNINNLSDITIDSYRIEGMESIVGGDLNDIFTLQFTAYGINISGGSGNDEINLLVSGAANIVNGNDGIDTFTLGTLNVATTINGGNGNDIFNINQDNAAADINGDAGDDDFYIAVGVNNNTLHGGSETGAGDEIIVAGTTNSWLVNQNDGGSVNNNSFDGIEVLTGNGTSDTLTVDVATLNGVWDIGTTQSVTVQTNDVVPVVIDTYSISGFEELTGGSQVDTFNLNQVINGLTINGGDDTSVNDILGANLVDGKLAFSDATLGNGTFSLSGNTVSFNDIQIYNDLGIGSGDFTITGPNSGTTYTLFAGGGVTFGNLSFSGVVTLYAGNSGDTFRIDGDFGGAVNGMDGLDVFQINTPTLTSATQLYAHNSTTVSNDNDRIEGVYVGQSGTVNYDWQIDNSTWTVGSAASGAINGALFYDIQRLNGSANGNILDTITSNLSTNTWNINSSNSTVDVYTFNNMESISGGSQVDTFNINATITGDINGNDGGDIFNINTSNAAANLYGNNGDDDFIIANGVTGNTIHGSTETGDADEVRIAGSNNSWLINATDGGVVDSNSFDGIEVLTGNGSNDTLTVNVNLMDADWTIDATNTVQILDTSSAVVDEYTFTGMENLTGGGLVDTFTINAALSGNINGAGGDDWFNINVVDAANLINGQGGDDTFVIVSGIDTQNLNGGTNNDTLTLLGTSANTWDIVGTSGNTVNATIGFDNIETVNGNDGVDIFNISSSVNTGDFLSINGLDGDDEFIIAFADHDVTISGGNQTDTITFSGSVTSSSVAINDNGTATFTQFVSAGNQTQSITADGIEIIEDKTSVTQYNVSGSSVSDNIVITDGAIGFDLVVELLPGLTVYLETFDSVNIDLLGDNDTIAFNSNIDFNGTLNLTAENIIANSNYSILASSISLNNFDNLGSSTTALDLGLASMAAGSLQLSLDNSANTVSGEVYLNTVTDTNLVNVDVNGDLHINITTALTGSGPVVVSGLTDLDGGVAVSLVLDSSTNDFNDLELNNFQSVSITDLNAINLTDVSVTSLQLNTNGDITNTGSVFVSDLFSATTGNNDINIGYSDLDTYAVNLNNLYIEQTNDISVRDSNGINLESIDLTGDLSLTLAGDLTQVMNSVLPVPNQVVVDDFAVTFVNGQYNIILDQLNDVRTFTVDNANQVTLNDTNGISVGSINTLSDFTLSSSGVLLQTGGWTIGGNLNLTLLNGAAVNLQDSANVIAGQINLNTFNLSNSFSNVVIYNDTDISLNSLNVTNDLTLVSNGDINALGDIVVQGVSSFDTDIDNSSDSFNVSLVSSGSNFNQITANNVSDLVVNDLDSVILNNININGDLSISVSDNINSVDALTVNGDTLLSSSNGGSISLTSSANLFNGMFSLDTATGQFTSLDINSSGQINVVDSGWLAANDITIDSDINMASDFSLESINGNLSHLGALDGYSNLVVTALQGDILFSQSDIGQQVALDTVSITGNTLSLGNITAVNGINLTSLTGDTELNSLSSSQQISINSASSVIANTIPGANVTADLLEIISVDGVIGSAGSLETAVNDISIYNSGTGSIDINNTGSVNVSSLVNENGSIFANATGTLIQSGDVTVNNGSSNVINISSGNAITMQEPAVTQNVSGDISYSAVEDIIISELRAPAGLISVTSTNGNVYTTNQPPNYFEPHIIGSDIEINAESGSFGQGQYYFVMSAPGGTVIINTLFNVKPVYTVPGPDNVFSTGTTILPTDTSSLLGGDQRTQFSELSTVDPTIFTEVRNFEEEETAILLPEDQQYSSEI